ncbi:lipid phosphate phosphatase 1 [Lactifluus subvellereus]|nr:lipid phosphate phosphatase 1 [Lactifluus subvellereus]
MAIMMTGLLRKAQNKINDISGDGSFYWFDGSYFVDWTVVLAFFFLSLFIQTQPIFERDFSPNDPLIQHPHTSEQIPSSINNMIAAAVPVVLAVFIGGYRNSAHEIHHGLLATTAGSALCRLITETLKNRVGRLRPDFLARCQWDPLQHACTGDVNKILDGRKSFPSGHSSTAFVGMTFTALFLAGKTAALCFSISPPPVSFLRSRLARLCLVLSPFAFSTWIAITRIEDYRHHKEDVIVGGLIGIFSGTICYLPYWPNPFSAASFSAEMTGRPRLASASDASSRSGGDDYRLVPGGAEFDSV